MSISCLFTFIYNVDNLPLVVMFLAAMEAANLATLDRGQQITKTKKIRKIFSRNTGKE